MAIKLPSDGFNVASFRTTRGLDNYDFSSVTYNHVQKTINVGNENGVDINPANNSLQSYTLIIKQKVEPKQHYLLFNLGNSSTLFYIDNNEYLITQTFVIPINQSVCTKKGF